MRNESEAIHKICLAGLEASGSIDCNKKLSAFFLIYISLRYL